ncbi:hypothetical protein [Stieleria varia]|uniref:Caspase domain protein n=1 Tax=Stieleria varia TaxID=2528005 RepID=A0A5C6ASD8_9BACT|nr:hypothetical protein [Stieleria varia]TWU02411.1 hypothetical protein Pla52n_34610 [Stieleria varia]
MSGTALMMRTLFNNPAWWPIAALLLIFAFSVAPTATSDDMIVVVGAAGTPEYADDFKLAAATWQQLAKLNELQCVTIGLSGSGEENSDRDQLSATIQKSKREKSETPLWLVLIGHGTFADSLAKFNLRGTDFSASEMSDWLADSQRTIVVINNASSSGPFINRLSADHRIIVTATKSGSEQNYTRFGKYFAQAMSSTAADLDHDDEVSVLEAFVMATREVDDFYQTEGRISTEHALLDDNGDGAGSSSKILAGLAVVKGPKTVDGKRAAKTTLSPTGETPRLTPEQSKRRDELESQLEIIRVANDGQSESDYQAKILPIMLELSRIYFPEEAASDAEAASKTPAER